MKRSCLPLLVRACAGLFTATLLACSALPDDNLGKLASSTGDTADGGTSGGHEGNGSVGDSSVGDASSDGGSPQECIPGTMWMCSDDLDHDNVAAPCDNAPDVFNPSQVDLDSDGMGDEIDPCPTVAGSSVAADSDDDGIGNACDSCPSLPSQYNVGAVAAGMPDAYRVRNIPDIGDADGDGIGDACDNCVAVPNCGDYDTETPWHPGDEIARDEGTTCQQDADDDLVGDACQGMQAPGAAGPVGFAPTDDFDQDGLTNAVDLCVRLPLLEQTPCDGDDACPSGSHCALGLGVCNHVDIDEDQVGDICDTCAVAPNPGQLESGPAVSDDADGDFIGAACETPGCDVLSDPHPVAFFAVASAGQCCTVALIEVDGELRTAATDLDQPLRDPDGVPLRVECSAADQAAHVCTRLPPGVAAAPGVLQLPAGCAAAADPISVIDPGIDGDVDLYWSYRCELPVLDQDHDGIGDACDLCPFDFDPENVPYIDDDGMVWQDRGKYCNGDYSADAHCGE
jgi:Thrombospondin type 3 repeat